MKIVNMMDNNPTVVIVKGSKTSEDKSKNPFPVELQMEWVKAVFPDVDTSVAPNGFLPGILGFIRKNGKEVTAKYRLFSRIRIPH
jgi:hypothetical protein